MNTSADVRMPSRHVETTLPTLKVEQLSKSFPGVQVLKSIDFDVCPGEVHALCGENGAGKSTLMRILAGNETPDGGDISFRGEYVKFRGPLDAKRRGILLIHQELSLVPEMTIAENIFLGDLPRKTFGRVDEKRLLARTDEVLKTMNYSLDPNARVGDLSIAQQQMVEIARAEAFQASVVIFDEPTASLTESEAEVLLGIIRDLKARNVAVIYISHKLKEVLEIADRVTVLRDGELQATLDARCTDADEITRLMVGRSLDQFYHKTERNVGDVVLRVEGLEVSGQVKGVSFSVRSGEILGLYGLIGAGRSETVEAIFGTRRMTAGQLFMEEREVVIRTPRDAMKLGIGLVPESRKSQGLVLGMGSRSNMSLSLLQELNRFQVLQRRLEDKVYDEYHKRLNIAATNGSKPIKLLSGGNQQKVVIGKWLARNPKLLILDEPTRGVDVGAKAEIHRIISTLASEGMAVLVVSSDMPEIIGISDRVLTFCQGKVSGEFAAEAVSEANLIKGAVGHHTL